VTERKETGVCYQNDYVTGTEYPFSLALGLVSVIWLYSCCLSVQDGAGQRIHDKAHGEH
jgi:hypothetical protein